MEKSSPTQVIRFGTFEADLRAGELRKGGIKLKLSGQPFQVLAILLERPGEVVSRDELQKRLWPDTFVDVDHNLNTAINKIREVLGDSSENPRFVETLPRRGYRFIAPVEGGDRHKIIFPENVREQNAETTRISTRNRLLRYPAFTAAIALLAGAGLFLFKSKPQGASLQRSLTRLTFDKGLQFGATWSPDGRFLAYSCNRGGKFDIWVQQLSGGDPVQITHGAGQNWQPDWSPDGKLIAYRSEEGEGGLFVVPALGGQGLERKVASFGYRPRWSPDSLQIMFQTRLELFDWNKLYLVDLDGSAPREIAAKFTEQHLGAMSAAWHPDGKRISIWAVEEHPSPSFWTVPIAGGPAVESEIPSDIAGQFELAASGTETLGGGPGWIVDSDFVWAPSGTAIYFERTFRGTRNLWKMRVNPDTLAAVAIERLTAGPGPDTGISISRDGKMLAFTGESESVGAMLFPFDGTRRVITARGEMATPPGVEAWRFSLSHDGKKLAFMGTRAGKCELWVKSIADGGETQIGNDQYCRGYSQWSPDGLLLAYRRFKRIKSSPKTQYEHQVMMWSLQRHAEEPLTDAGVGWRGVNGWSPDGKSILVRKKSGNSDSDSVWNMGVAAAPHAGAAAQNINFGPAYNSYFEQMYSPDGKWIIFEAVRKPPQVESTLYVIPVTGGARIRITDGKQWDDKPRFSPDGKTIYFVSGRGGFYNVWGIRFNPSNGHPVGEPFRLTAFEGPALNVPNRIDLVDLAVDQTKLVLTMSEVSGGIWVLDKVGD